MESLFEHLIYPTNLAIVVPNHAIDLPLVFILSVLSTLYYLNSRRFFRPEIAQHSMSSHLQLTCVLAYYIATAGFYI